ncbi:hypothetical protein SAMN04487949_0652 [Halogranum gelatinilyticum]|uniref:Uncharacterized protein n=1 Tax=Halogranum gelatinilyticum TaxID=660521 RepID=A0A1G9Q1X5_9EURY|nr:hypothetical protein [Halogranum gelatinilyticum]SDM05024.1 hypothetical protein SAMN04487949_0652 [Halogranum gelatinilyticum]
MQTRANYATVYVGAQLAPEGHSLDLEWATDAGDETDAFEFTVPTDEPTDAYIGLQAFDVAEYGHEILVNGEPLGGFDIPPNEGWQYWVDTLSGATLHEGTNTVQFRRNAEGTDAFAVGTVTVHWKEPVE